VAAVKLIWTPGAVRDLERIHAYIAADTPRYADVVAARIVEAFDRLADFPQSGRVVPELGRGDVRELIHRAYRLVYQLRDDRAEILAIHHGARRFPDLRLSE
jgi:toxin ParE1/3/4